MHRYPLIFLMFAAVLSACNPINEKDFAGDWIINQATFDKADIVMASKTFKVVMLPVGFERKSSINFNTSDFTVDMPGMYTEDLPCKWIIRDKKLVLKFDSLRFKNIVLLSTGKIKSDSTKRDSILKTLDIKTPLSVYIGSYNIEKTENGLILTSPTTRFELLNTDRILKKQIDGMFEGM